MSIRSIEAIPFRPPYDMFGPKPLLGGQPRQMDILLVRVETDDGVIGWGEAFGFVVWPATRAALEQVVAPIVIGRDEADIAGLMNQLNRQLHLLGRSGPVTYALSGLDIALWDIAGKRAGLPIAALLGGACHSELPAYASLVRYGDPALVARNAAAACARGYQAIKLHELGVAHVQAAREAIGPDIGLMLDVNCPWSVAEALEMAKQFRRFELSWFEEPVWPPEDFAGLAEVRRQAGMPVSAGENVTSVKQFEHMFAASALDIAQPSVTKIGGITEFMSVLALAGKYGVPVVPHSPYFGPGLLASLQIAATLPAVTMIEYSFMDLEANPLGDAISVHDGTIRIPTGPGLGRDPDLEIVERYRLP